MADKQRTPPQNRAMHKYFTLLANALNDAGYDMFKALETINYSLEVPWTPESVKSELWKPLQIAMTGKKSTAALDSDEPAKIYEVFNRNIAEKLGVSVHFPDKHGQLLEGEK